MNTEPPFVFFATAKRYLAERVFYDRRTDYYCGCAYSEDLEVDPSTCGYEPRRDNRRAWRIEVEHVVPAARFGQHRACWSGETCDGQRGRACCSRPVERGGDEEFRAMVGDLRNLVPVVGELNADRSARPYGEVEGEPREFGACDFEVDRSSREGGRRAPRQRPRRPRPRLALDGRRVPRRPRPHG